MKMDKHNSSLMDALENVVLAERESLFSYGTCLMFLLDTGFYDWTAQFTKDSIGNRTRAQASNFDYSKTTNVAAKTYSVDLMPTTPHEIKFTVRIAQQHACIESPSYIPDVLALRVA